LTFDQVTVTAFDDVYDVAAYADTSVGALGMNFSENASLRVLSEHPAVNTAQTETIAANSACLSRINTSNPLCSNQKIKATLLYMGQSR